MNAEFLEKKLYSHLQYDAGFLSLRSTDTLKFRYNWAWTRENLTSGFVNNKVMTNQPVHPRSLISAFVIYFLESIISKFATSEIPVSNEPL